MNITSSATDNITRQGDTHKAQPQRRLDMPSRDFTGRSAYEYKTKQGKARHVPEDIFEQWLWSRLSSLANILMNDARQKALSVNEKTGEVSEGTATTIDAQALAQSLLELVWSEAADRITVEQQGSHQKNPNSITIAHLEDMVERIASHQRSTWNPNYVDELRARASVNGKKSKRPRDNTVFEVLGFPFADHSIKANKDIIAAALGKSVRTVERHLKDYREAPSGWVATSPSRYLSQPEPKAPTSTPRYLSRGDQLMALAYDDRPRAKKAEPVDWTYLLDIPETQAPEANVPPEWDTRSLMFLNAELATIEDDGLSNDLESWMEHELLAA